MTIGGVCVYLLFFESFKSTTGFFHPLKEIYSSAILINDRNNKESIMLVSSVIDKISNFTANHKGNYFIRNSSTLIQRVSHNHLSDILKAAASL